MRRILAALALALLLASCAAPPAKTAPAAAPAPRSGQTEHMESSWVESSPRPLLETEILEAYERAVRVYGWFDLEPLPLSEESATVEGERYYRVNMEGIEDLEDLRVYLRGVFSQELTERLLDGESARIQYREVEGVLYASGSRRERDAGVGPAQVEAEQMDEGSYAVNVMVDLLDEDGKTVIGVGSWSFPYVFAEDRWVFTDFRLVY